MSPNTDPTTVSPAPQEHGTEPEGGYPEQRHAGAVGLGPDYGKGASGSDKITGWKEEIEGKITRNHEKYQHGKDLRTGEIKKRAKEDDQSPFEQAHKKDTGPQKQRPPEHMPKSGNSPSGPGETTSHSPDQGA